jgi:deoxyadenosine/deoxycytidine kinase
LLHTSKAPQKLLNQLLKVEKKLGRVRNQVAEYQPRPIDIDILAFDEEIVATETLQIPHSMLQKRKFVLQPLLDLDSNWEHPILKKSVAQLLAETEDDSPIDAVHIIGSPIEKLGIQSFNYIAIEGNIGAGKTTLATKLAEDCNAKLILERFADNPFLPKFYKDQSRYAFPLEMSFLADRYQQLSDDLAQFDLFKDFVVADYHIFKSLIFAKVTLQEDEFRLYKTMFDIIYKEMTKPDLYVYLYQNTARLLQNIKKRGRSYEQEISAEYLEKINQGYLDYIKTQTDLNVLIIDVSELDFIKNQADYVFVLEKIQQATLSD